MPGTIGIELDTNFVTYLGWLVPWGMPVTLLADTAEEITEAQHQLVRIGIDRPAGAADGGVDAWAPDADRRGYEVVDLARLARLDDPLVLDSRRSGEHAAAHIDGVTHIPLRELLDRLDEVPEGPVHVHCASGYRASIAASLLDRAGHDVVLVDDDFDHAADDRLALSGG